MPSRSWRMGERILRWSRNGEAKLALSILKRLPPQQRAHAVDVLLNESLLVETSHGGIRFLNHSRGSCKRALTLLTKEPDSLKWIDAMRPGSVFWDIGANVGVLTLYAASRGDLDVWAFEPAAVNYYNLVANCELNGLERHARCLQLGFSDTGESPTFMSRNSRLPIRSRSDGAPSPRSTIRIIRHSSGSAVHRRRLHRAVPGRMPELHQNRCSRPHARDPHRSAAHIVAARALASSG